MRVLNEAFGQRRNAIAILVLASVALVVLSFSFLPWQLSIPTSILGLMMIIAADTDARTMLLPDSLTIGAVWVGLLTMPLIQMNEPWIAIGDAILRGAGTALLLGFVRKTYEVARGIEGIGLGDVKLAAAIGVWLPIDKIPLCFLIASLAGLVLVVIRYNSQPIGLIKLPFGAFLCPALWLVVFANFVLIARVETIT